MNTLRNNLNKLTLTRDNEHLGIFFDLGDDIDPIHVVYWHFEEWEEDAELVVPAMLQAMELFYTDRVLLLETLGWDLDEEL